MKTFVFVLAVLTVATAANAQSAVSIQGAPCATPPVLHCPDANCPSDRIINPGPIVEMKTRRTFFLDYPCDLKADEKVTFILSLHGGGSYGNWQRHYFPIVDFKDKYRLVIATPNSPTRAWSAVDDDYLQNIVTFVVDQFGRQNIKAFWLGTAPDLTAAAAALREIPASDFSFIYETGEREVDDKGIPETSAWASKFSCGPRAKSEEIVDTKPGYVYDSTRQNPPNPAWGLLPRPGNATVFRYSNCKDGRVVADVVRIVKGHTEGLEPNITEALVKLMLSASGGKVQKAAAGSQ